MKKVLQKVSPYIIYFTLYSIIGWLYEVFLEVIVYKWGFTNRGVLFGPYCPVYGFGALLFIFLVYPLIRKENLKKKIIMIPIVFLLCMLSATVLELLTSYLCEFFLGSWPWQTYASYKYNFQARIALSPSLRFGLGGLLFLYLLQPIFEKIVHNRKKENIDVIAVIIVIIFLLDILYTLGNKILL